MEVEELTRLVEEEKIAEDKIKQAQRSAEDIIKNAREQADRIIVEAQNSLLSTEPQEHRRREFEEEKQKIEQEHREKMKSLKKLAESNLDRAVRMIVEDVTRVSA